MNQEILKIVNRIKENLRQLDSEDNELVDEIYDSLSEIEDLIYEQESDTFRDEEEGY
jgi:hypothetical protein